MSETLLGLRHKINSAHDLSSVVRTMKTLAASSINQYEEAIKSLATYTQTVELGLAACLRSLSPANLHIHQRPTAAVIIVIGSDQGLVGTFNDDLASFTAKELRNDTRTKQLFSVGERINNQLVTLGVATHQKLHTPTSVEAITECCNTLLLHFASYANGQAGLSLFYNQQYSGSLYKAHQQTILPLDCAWQQHLHQRRWPTNNLPELFDITRTTMPALLREYIFVSIFRACAQSLASENSCRLAAMQRAEKNIDEQLEGLQRNYHHLRQQNIDAELFDVIYGFTSF